MAIQLAQSTGLLSFGFYLNTNTMDGVYSHFFGGFKYPGFSFLSVFDFKLAFNFPAITGFDLLGVQLFETALALQIITILLSLPKKVFWIYQRRCNNTRGEQTVVFKAENTPGVVSRAENEHTL